MRIDFANDKIAESQRSLFILEQTTASGKKVQARALAMDFSKLDGPHWDAFNAEVENLDIGVLGMWVSLKKCSTAHFLLSQQRWQVSHLPLGFR